MKPEKNLFELIRNSDEKAFEILFRIYFEPLVNYCFQLIKDRDLAKGITQQVFVNIWEKRGSLQTQSPAPFLYKSVKNKCLNYIRHNKVKDKFQNDIKYEDFSYEIELKESSEKLTKIYNSIEKLAPKCKQIFIMSRMHGLTHNEIAEELNLSTKTIKNQIGKALKILQSELAHLNISLIICLLHFFQKNI